MNTKGLPEGGPFFCGGDLGFAIYDLRFAGAPPHGPTLRSFVACASSPPHPHCAPSSLVRVYQALVPSGLLKENLQSRTSHLVNRTS